MTRPTEDGTAAGIHGIIVGCAVMAASHAESAAAIVLAVLVTLTTYWAAERYARIVAERIHRGRRPGWQRLRRQLTAGWAMVTASALPLVVLVTARVLGASVSGAVWWALGCGTLLLAGAGWRIGGPGRLSPVERLLSTLAAALFGVLMIALKAVLH